MAPPGTPPHGPFAPALPPAAAGMRGAIHPRAPGPGSQRVAHSLTQRVALSAPTGSRARAAGRLQAAVFETARPVQQSGREAGATESLELARWLAAGGGSCRGVREAEQPGMGRGLVASRTASAGEVLVTVPHSLQLTEAQPLDAAWAHHARASDGLPPELASLAKLALVAASERAKGGRSRWAPYLASLPASVPGLPLLWPEEDIQQLQYPPAILAAEARRRWVRDTAAELAHAAAPHGSAPLTDLLGWGMAMASSRGVRAGPAGEGALLPVVDLCNHRPEPNCEIVAARDCAALVAQQRLAEGEPLSLCYDRQPNARLLADYGFLQPANPHEAVHFPVTLACLQQAVSALPHPPAPAALQPWQAAALQRLGLCWEDEPVMVEVGPGQPDIDPCLLAAARVLCSASPEDLAGRDVAQLGSPDQPLAAGVEVRALLVAAIACELFLAQVGTSVEEDRHVLASGQSRLTPNQRLAVRYRMELKEVVSTAVERLMDRAAAL